MGELVRGHGGRIVYEADAVAAETDPEQTPLYELTWNHSRLQALKKDRGVTYTQTLHPADRVRRHHAGAIWRGIDGPSRIHPLRGLSGWTRSWRSMRRGVSSSPTRTS
jgi:hypothetical protein